MVGTRLGTCSVWSSLGWSKVLFERDRGEELGQNGREEEMRKREKSGGIERRMRLPSPTDEAYTRDDNRCDGGRSF